MSDETVDQSLGRGLKCFVIGPIGDPNAALGSESRDRFENATQVWENIVEPATARFGLDPLRADMITEQGDITEQIFLLLRDADIVVADLSGGNPNVMYELGLRHTRDKLTIQIGEHGGLPFDVHTIRTIQFKRTAAGFIDARDNLIKTLRTGLTRGAAPIMATKLWSSIPGPSDQFGQTIAVEMMQVAYPFFYHVQDMHRRPSYGQEVPRDQAPAREAVWQALDDQYAEFRPAARIVEAKLDVEHGAQDSDARWYWHGVVDILTARYYAIAQPRKRFEDLTNRHGQHHTDPDDMARIPRAVRDLLPTVEELNDQAAATKRFETLLDLAVKRVLERSAGTVVLPHPDQSTP